MASANTVDPLFLFQLREEEQQGPQNVFKWQHVNAKYEIHASILNRLDLPILLPHCLDIKAKVESAVGIAARVGPSLFKVLPRTLSIPLKSIWDLAWAQHQQDNGTHEENEETSQAS